LNLLKRFPIYPWLFAIFPILALLSNNLGQVDLAVALRPLIISLVSATVLVLFLRLIFKEWLKPALITTLILVLFFSYGQVQSLISNTIIFGFAIGRRIFIVPLYVILSGLGLWLILRLKIPSQDQAMVLNLIGLFLLVFPLYNIIGWSIKTSSEMAKYNADNPVLDAYSEKLVPKNPQALPDVYYIVMDEFGRQDVLKNDWNTDDSGFINELRKMGFYVADCSMSNYFHTELSLTSTLNFEYLQNLVSGIGPGKNISALVPFLEHSQARRELEGAGYKTVSYSVASYIFNWSDATVSYTYQKDGLQPFEYLLLNSTAFRALSGGRSNGNMQVDDDASSDNNSEMDNDNNFPYKSYYDREIYEFKLMDNITSFPGPKFVFAHIFGSHMPYVFKSDGSVNTNSNYWGGDPDGNPTSGFYNEDGYRQSIQFDSNRMLGIVKNILEHSKTPPIIVLAGDHGKGAHRPMNLNAYYLPDGGEKYLYPSITPVNTFRIIFNTYFGTHYDLLPDYSYSSNLMATDRFTLYNETNPACLNK
jgi:hypothetical protein